MSFGRPDHLLIAQLQELNNFPTDLVAIVMVIGGFDATLALGPPVRPLRTLLGLALVCFVPGYLLVTILSPTAIPEDEAETGGTRLDRDSLERVALSVGGSLLLTPLLGLSMGLLGLAYSPESVVAVFNILIVTLVLIALYRRLQVRPENRLRVTVHRRGLSTIRDTVRSPTVSGFLDAALVVVVLVAAGTMATALVAPIEGEHSTTLTVMGHNESGQPVAGDYPRNLTTTGTESLTVAVTNNERTEQEYTVVATLQELEQNTTVVTDQRELRRESQTLDTGEHWEFEHTLEDTDQTGQRLRLVYTLYRGDSPQNPSVDTAYRSVYLWVENPGVAG